MLCICENVHVYSTVLRGKPEVRLFENEICKKKMLDVVAAVRRGSKLRVMAYCVLDNEIHLMVEGENYQQAKEGLTLMKKGYEQVLFAEGKQSAGIRLWKSSPIREIPVEWKAIRQCIRLHMLPIKYHLVTRPEDYWWCSYNDYLGREWLPLTDTEILLSWVDGDPGKARKDFRRKHRG